VEMYRNGGAGDNGLPITIERASHVDYLATVPTFRLVCSPLQIRAAMLPHFCNLFAWILGEIWWQYWQCCRIL